MAALTVFSTNPLSFNVSVWIITCTSIASATDRQQSMAPGVVPQSSCSFNAQAPASTCSSSAAGSEALPLPAKARFIGKASAACSIRPICQGPGVQVVAERPMRRAGAAAKHRGQAGMQRILDLLRADEMDVAVEPAGGQNTSLAGDRLGAGADDDVDAGLRVGVARLADPGDAPVLQADIRLVDTGVVHESAHW